MVKLLNVFITTTIVAEVESGSTFREAFLVTEVQESYKTRTMLHSATPAETCFSSKLRRSVQKWL